jgi:hypothetical protein
MGFVDKSEWSTAIELSAEHGTGPRKCFFHLTDMVILNTILIQKSCGSKMTHKHFCEVTARELIIHLHEENVTASGITKDTPSPFASQLSRLEVKHSHN